MNCTRDKYTHRHTYYRQTVNKNTKSTYFGDSPVTNSPFSFPSLSRPVQLYPRFRTISSPYQTPRPDIWLRAKEDEAFKLEIWGSVARFWDNETLMLHRRKDVDRRAVDRRVGIRCFLNRKKFICQS